MTPNPIDLPFRAADLWLRTVQLGLRTAMLPLELVGRAVAPQRQRPRPASEPPRSPILELRAAEDAAARPTDALPSVGAEVHVADDEPWPGYANMSPADVIGRLADADEATRAVVRLYESTHDNRSAVLAQTEA